MSLIPSEESNEPKGPLFDSGYVTTMSHFYRGELGRIMAWRSRLDVTTTWAVTTTSSIVTVAFTFPQLPHVIFFFNLGIVWMMLWIEARRYRFYDAFRARVRMLEAHFLVPSVMQSGSLLQGDWRKLVCEDLLLPSFKISTLEAVGRRLKRNYMFIFVIILLAWIIKVILHAPAAHPVTGIPSFFQAMAIQHVPAWFIAIVFVSTYVIVIGLTIFVSRKTTGEISEFGAHRSMWRI